MNELNRAIERAQKIIREGEGISQLPETKKFLETKGLTSIRELDDRGKKELEQHLQEVLELLSAQVPMNKIN